MTSKQSWTFEEINEHFRSEIETRLDESCFMSGLLRDMVAFHLSTGGKRLRALLPVWVCANLGGDPADAVDAGAGFELLHNATLVHDDLQDGDQVRRGKPTVWKRWGDAQAINAGDSLYFQGIRQMLRAKGGEQCVDIASRALVRVIQGQTMEFQLQLPDGEPDQLPPTLGSWESMARGKTAALFGACMAGGAIAAGASEEVVEELAEYGEQIGLLFQVQDDFLDLVGSKGRERNATDIAEGKLSFPVIWALQNAARDDATRLAFIVATPREETTDPMIDEGLTILEGSGAIEATAAWLKELGERLTNSQWAALVPQLPERILAPVREALKN